MADPDLAALLAADPAAFARERLRSLGLPDAPLTAADGWSNRVFLGPSHVVRLGSGRFRAAFAHEAAVLRMLPPAVPSAPVRGHGQSGDREWLVQDRMPGRPLRQVWADLTAAQRRAAIDWSRRSTSRPAPTRPTPGATYARCCARVSVGRGGERRRRRYTIAWCILCSMVIRKQILVPPEIDRRIRQLARQKGISQSALIAEAVAALPDPAEQAQRVLDFAGAIADAPPTLSQEVDAVLYG